jgi:hypothetical protein
MTTRKRSAEGYEWREVALPELKLGRRLALLSLQGASIRDLLGDRYLVLRGKKAPPYHPVPVLNGLLLAELIQAPEGSTGQEAFSTITNAG